MNEVLLRLANGTSLFVPGSLRSITTYVLLEQEAWFEKELEFLYRWTRPGMTLIDIGANVGVYSLPLAKLIAPSGRIYAYEPGSEARGLLQENAKQNCCPNLEVIASALSDGEREGRLAIGWSNELSGLGDGGAGETVQVTSLDLEEMRRDWVSPDFVKIDAEGEEERILRGGQSFFARHSPLIMFEIKSGSCADENLRSVVRAMGYKVYRLLAGAPILVPDRPDQKLDAYELNLFAAKPDRAQTLAGEGFLVETEMAWEPNGAARRIAIALLQTMPFARSVTGNGNGFEALDPVYRDALAAYAHWRAATVPAAERYGALLFACRTLTDLCNRAATFPRLSTLARAAWDAGLRSQSVQILRVLADRAAQLTLTEPFWPPCPRYEAIDPGNQLNVWFIAAVVEQMERSMSFSTLFASPSPYLPWLCTTPFATAEMERRCLLATMRTGRRPAIPERLCNDAADNLNAKIWRAGLDVLR